MTEKKKEKILLSLSFFLCSRPSGSFFLFFHEKSNPRTDGSMMDQRFCIIMGSFHACNNTVRRALAAAAGVLCVISQTKASQDKSKCIALKRYYWARKGSKPRLSRCSVAFKTWFLVSLPPTAHYSRIYYRWCFVNCPHATATTVRRKPSIQLQHADPSPVFLPVGAL